MNPFTDFKINYDTFIQAGVQGYPEYYLHIVMQDTTGSKQNIQSKVNSQVLI